jgi:hypothetical protein
MLDNLALNVTASSESADLLRLTVFGGGLSIGTGDELALVPLPSGVLSGDTCQQQPIASYNHLNFTNCEFNLNTGYLKDAGASSVCGSTQRSVLIPTPDITLGVCYQVCSVFLDSKFEFLEKLHLIDLVDLDAAHVIFSGPGRSDSGLQ